MARIPIQEKGKKPTYLDDKDYLSGGEGKVFVKGDTAYKIYHDLTKVLPEAKVQELQPIAGPNVLGPKAMLYDPASGKPIGFTMQYASGTISLPQLFTTAFRNRNGVTPEMSVKLVQKMIEVLQGIHDKGVLNPDGNENNYLVDEASFVIPYFIDVDSFQTRSYPTMVQMPSIKDWHTNGFTVLSDWFSFGVVATQIFVGIHPYKGTHPDYAKYDMENRMKNNASIFGKKVSLPPAVRSFDLIPDDLRPWLVDLLEHGKRTLPPMVVVGKIVKPQITTIIGSQQLTILMHTDIRDTILGCEFLNGQLVVYTSKEIRIGNKRFPSPSKTVGLIHPIGCTDPLFVDIVGGILTIKNSKTGEELCKNKILAQKKMITEGRVYIQFEDRLSEIQVLPLGSMVIPTIKTSWNILPKSTHAYRGVFYSDVLGVPHLYIPYATGSMGIFKVDELKGYRIIDAKCENGVCIIMASNKKSATIDRIIIKFKFDTNQYIVEIEKDVTLSAVNFVTLDNGIVVLLTGDDSVEAFHKGFTAPKKIIDKAGINGSAVLFKNMNEVYFFADEKIYTIQMRK